LRTVGQPTCQHCLLARLDFRRAMKASISIPFIFACLLIAANYFVAVHFEDFAYEDVREHAPYGNTYLRLLGTERTVDRSHSVRGSPYDLHIFANLNESFARMTSDECYLELQNASLIPDDVRVGRLQLNNSRSKIKRDYKNELGSSFSYSNISLDYLDYSLQGTIVASDRCVQNVQHEIMIKIHRRHTNELITLWDMLMGI